MVGRIYSIVKAEASIYGQLDLLELTNFVKNCHVNMNSKY